MAGERQVRVFGGVQDGGFAIIPDSAEPGFRRLLTNGGEKTQYTLREYAPPIDTASSGMRDALVADGMRWPLLDPTPA